MKRTIFRLIKKIAFLFVSLLVATLVLMWADHFNKTTFPALSGSYQVGRTLCYWKDSVQLDSLSPKPFAPRQLIAWIWFPAEKRKQNGPFAPYLPPAWLKAVNQQRGKLISSLLTRDLSKVGTHSFSDEQLALQPKTFPIILFRAGLAANVSNYSSLAEDLASHGYVVVGVDAPYRTSIVILPNSQVIYRSPRNDADQYVGAQQEQVAKQLVHAWSRDMSFALDRLKALNAAYPTGRFSGRLDLQRVGIAGHSLGGATALQFCHDDKRCKAGVDIDGAPLGTVIRQGVVQPFLFFMADHGDESDPETREVLSNVRTVFQGQHKAQKYWFKLSGANHFGFSDDGALLKSQVIMRLLNFFKIVPVNGRKQLAITSSYLSSFFDTFLKASPESPFRAPAKYPGVKVER